MGKVINVTTLFLDIGGVLLTNGWGHDFRMLAAAKFKLDINELETRHQLAFVTYEEGRITMDEYLNRVVFWQKRDFSSAQFQQFMFGQSAPYAEMIEYIQQLKAKYHLKIAVVSNEARELNDHRINKFQLGSFVDFFISSCFVQLRKPDAAIFKLALDIAHVRPENVIYIDDVEMFVDVARDLGIASIHHKDHLSTSAALASMGLNLG